MAVTIGDLVARLRLDAAKFRTGLVQVESRLRRTSENFKRLGGDLTRFVTLPLTVAAGASVKFAVAFDTEMTKIETLVGVASKQVDAWRKNILAIAPAVGVGPGELARALFVVTSAGQRGAVALDIVTKAAQASAVGLGDTATTARAVTGALQAYSRSGLTAARATDILVATVRAGNLEAADLASSLGRVIGIAAQVGISFDQLGAFIATFTRLGVSAEESVTALRGIITSLLKPTDQTREALALLGTTVGELRASVKEDLAVALVELVARSKDSEEAIAAIVPNVRALAGVLGTAGAQGEQFIQISKEIADSTGILGEAFARVAETPGFKFKQLLATLQVAGIQLGNQLLPAFVKIITVVAGAVNAFANLSAGTRTVITRIAGFAAVIGPLAITIGVLTAVLSGVIGTIALVGTGIGLLAAVVIGIRTNFLGMGDAAAKAFEVIVNAADIGFTALADVAKPVINFVIASFVGMGKTAMIVFDEFIKEPFAKAFDFIKDKAEVVLGAIAKGFELLGRLGAGVAAKLKGFFGEVGDVAKNETGKLGEIVAAAFGEAFETDFVGKFATAMKAGIGKALNLLIGLVDKVKAIGGEIASFLLPTLEEATTGLRGVQGELDKTGTSFGKAAGKASEFVQELGQIGEQGGRQLIRGLIEGAQSLVDTLRNVIIEIIQAGIIFAIKRALLIGSPSRVTMRFGEDVVKGFILGMQSTIGQLQAASTRMASVPALATASAGPSLTLTADFSAIPQPITPDAIAVNAAWQRVFAETFRQLQFGGFRP